MKNRLKLMMAITALTLLTMAGWLHLMAVAAAPAVGMVGINGAVCAYPSIISALDDANDGDTFYLSPGVFNESLGAVALDIHLTAATADCTAADPDANRADYVINGTMFALEGGVAQIAALHTVTFTNVTLQNGQAAWGGILYVDQGATAVLQNVRLYNGFANDSGGLIFVAETGVVTISQNSVLSGGTAGVNGGGLALEGYGELVNSRINGSQAPRGGGAAVSGEGRLVMVNGMIGGNQAGEGGGVHLTDNAELEMAQNSGLINNQATMNGGGIWAGGSMSAVILYDSSHIVSNNAADSGGGVYAEGSVSLVLGDQSYIGAPGQSNTAVLGGGVYADGVSQQILILDEAAVRHNTATSSGGGIYLTGGSELDVQGGIIEGNTSGWFGGGISILGGHLQLTGALVAQNEAAHSGGGIAQGPGDVITIINSQIISNTAGDAGGGIVSFGDIFWSDTDGSSRLAGNEAGMHGGGIFKGSPAPAIFYAVGDQGQIVIAGNKVDGDGGGIYNHQGALSLVGGVRLEDNESMGDGGGIYQVEGTLAAGNPGTAKRMIIGHNEAVNGRGGGIYLHNVSDVEFANILIQNNRADNNGGGLYAVNSSARMRDGHIHHNEANFGGGVYLLNATLRMTSHPLTPPGSPPPCANVTLPANHYCSELRGNVSADLGGAIGMETGSELILEYTAVVSNTAAMVGGIYSSGPAQIEITNSLLAHNVGTALRVEDNASLNLVQNTFTGNNWAVMVASPFASVAQANNIFWSNNFGVLSAVAAPAGCSISQNGVWGTADDPLFQTTLRGDYRLAVGSPARDACAIGADLDLDGVPRPQGVQYDAGAFEMGPPIFLFPAALAVLEGDSGLTEVPFVVWLSEPGAAAAQVTVTSVAGTAQPDEDYVPVDVTLTFPAGVISQTVTLQIVGDILHEGDETFELRLSDPQGALLLADTAVITITDDDPQPTLTVADASVVEGDEGSTPMLFAVTLSHPSAFTVTVDFATGDVGDTATPDVDYQATAGTVTILPGQTTAVITVRVYGDEEEEEDEQFSLRLFNPQGAFLATPSATGTIIDDDGLSYLYLPIIIR